MRTVWILVLVALALLSPATHAIPPKQEKIFWAKVDEGQAHFVKKAYTEALASWQAAYAMWPHPDVLWNLGRAQEELGALELAVAAFEAYAALDKVTAAHKKEALERLAALRERLRLTRPARITVTTGSSVASVEVDGQPAGQGATVGFERAPGTYRVRVSALDCTPAEVEVVVGPGEQKSVTATPKPIPPARLTVKSPVSDVVVLIGDRREPANTPLSVRPGVLVVHVEAPGRPVVELPLTLAPGEQRVLDVALPPPKPGVPYPNWAGTYLVLPLVETEDVVRLERASVTLAESGQALTGAASISRTEPLKEWRRPYCDGQTTLSWTASYRVAVLANDDAEVIRFQDGRILTCSCPRYCAVTREFDVPARRLPGREGVLGKTVLLLRDELAGAATTGQQPVQSVDAAVGSWRITWWQGRPQPVNLGLGLEVSGTGVSGTLALRQTGPVMSYDRGKCDGQSTWEQDGQYAVSGALEAGRLALKPTPNGELRCTCAGKCLPVPPQAPQSLEFLVSGRYLVSGLEGKPTVLQRIAP